MLLRRLLTPLLYADIFFRDAIAAFSAAADGSLYAAACFSPCFFAFDISFYYAIAMRLLLDAAFSMFSLYFHYCH